MEAADLPTDDIKFVEIGELGGVCNEIIVLEVD